MPSEICDVPNVRLGVAGSTGRRKCTSRHNHRLAANKHSSTDPDVRAVTVMLATLRAAVENTIEGRHVAGAACLARPPLDLDCFFAAIINPLRGSGRIVADPDASRRVDPRSGSAPSRTDRIKHLS
jgi:hypothetical protein